MTRELVVLLNEQPVGRVTYDSGRVQFAYYEAWRAADDAYPLSLSMPLVVAEHNEKVVSPYLWGLLPDNERVLDRWGSQFGVSPRNPFALLSHVGEDCAGAVQFVHPDRVEKLLATQPSDSNVQWLTEAEIAERLRALNQNPSAWRRPGDTGQFSLAGAQPKTAFYHKANRWGIPSGRMATTHIFKPPLTGFDAFAENEHLSLELAHALGLAAAHSRVQWFEDQVAIIVARYDRQATASGVTRIHQEDFCQALGVMPTLRYENEGGPGAQEIVELLRTYSREPGMDVNSFVEALGFSWLIGGTDAHAKNYSVLIGAGGRVRLAPLYDLASALPYPQINPHEMKLAMRIGREYVIKRIGLGAWDKFARDLRVSRDFVYTRLLEMAEQIPDRVNDVRRQAESDGLTDQLVPRYASMVAARAARCADVLRRAAVLEKDAAHLPR